ncbi:hypothetical protein GCM10010116_53730 [Microbispora rosea subsp. aerata]|nr:DUF5685 family protein [Microbispora rosea]GGO26778.1 hypothetical protein GCM10010116_53730 [Microbispora rosea subsp. aerata]GIH58410.1 hypothetical protein Mro02_53240 [Microbispora rosea subsp. aerata]GLJ84017.1 hypothetical protein GCM10017588_27450 [Microbispora rosea subsp. aerata]
MFGILRPCARHSCPSVHEAWRAHLCGLCLTLRDRHGHLARMATNYDGLILSVLTEAQTRAAAGPNRRTAGPCALRGFRSAEVVPSDDRGARLAAVVSLALAAGKIRDHASDGDGIAARRVSGVPMRATAAAWATAARRGAESIGFDTAVLTEVSARQALLEASPGRALLDVTEPTETAVAAAFAHTAVLAGRPGNAESLREAGRFFGRIAHLIDAAEDLAEDRARGAYNPLDATGTSPAGARRVCEEALHGLRLAVRDLDLEERHLVEALLCGETRRAIDRAFGPRAHGASCATHRARSGDASPAPPEAPPGEPPMPPKEPPRAPAPRPGIALTAAAGIAVFLTCGLYRPPWSTKRDAPWHERCFCDECGDCCDCSNCCDCCDCCDCCSGDGCCSCDGCCCDCGS